MKKKRMRLFSILTLILTVSYAKAQEKERFKFAQTYVGLGTGVLAGNDNLISYQRATIGGLHFWGKADFYVSFALGNQNLGEGYNFNEGVQTGARWIPFGLKNNGFRPFIGAHWQTPALFGDDIPTLEKNAISIETGLYYVFKKSWTLELGLRHNPFNTWKLPYSNNHLSSAQWAFDLAIKKHFDFTAGTNAKWANEKAIEMTSKGHASTFGFGVGMSSAIAIAPITHLEKNGYEPNLAQVSLMPEFGLSYYTAKREMVFRLVYRAPTRFVRNKAFAYQLKDRRLSFETFKFLFDYQGFMPFVGIGLSNSIYALTFNSNNQSNISENGNNQSVSIVFGWDIRPTQAEWFILRTSLRYQPRLGFNQYAKAHFSRDLEFNFIQMVVYPQRMKYHF
ncbi:MAG: hypothetical protein JXQ87_06950 [Bacteroidia bacterium]